MIKSKNTETYGVDRSTPSDRRQVFGFFFFYAVFYFLLLIISDKSVFNGISIFRKPASRAASADIKSSDSCAAIENDGIWFVLLSCFHDAKIIKITHTEKYGNGCIVMQVDLKNTTTEFKRGFGKFDIYFNHAKFSEQPPRTEDMNILSLDLIQGSQNLTIRMELDYFTGRQAHECLREIECRGIEVKPCKK